MSQEYKLPYGYKWFNGIVLSEQETDIYNAYTREETLRYYPETIEQLKDYRHQFLLRCFAYHLGI